MGKFCQTTTLQQTTVQFQLLALIEITSRFLDLQDSARLPGATALQTFVLLLLREPRVEGRRQQLRGLRRAAGGRGCT